MTQRIKHRAIVEYVGSITDMHGPWSVESRGARLKLRSAYGLTLVDVRPASVRPLDVPPLTPARADALRALFNLRGYAVSTRARNWLIAQNLARFDEDENRLRLTPIGFELAGALPRYY